MYGSDLLYTFGERTYSLRRRRRADRTCRATRERFCCASSRARDTFSAPIAAPARAGSCRIATTRRRRRCAAPARTRASRRTPATGSAKLQINTRTPGYETNDYAFQQRADYIWYNANIGRFWTKPTSWYQTLTRSPAGRPSETSRAIDTGAATASVLRRRRRRQFWNVTAFHIHRPAVIDDRPAARRPGRENVRQPLRRRPTSRPTRGTRGSGARACSALLGRARRHEPGVSRERDLSAGAERQPVVRTVVEPVARHAAVRRRGRRQRPRQRSTERGT